MFYVYFLALDSRNVYKGFTDNLRRRISEHKRGKVKSTKKYKLIKLIGYEAYLKKGDALRREKFLKTNKGRQLFRQQYRDVLLENNIKL